ncbi:phosphoethanolamine transferase [Edwardsiella tarda]|uniref:Sulfatase-like hydrolase/transferase n=1 Tax=Edwardsiella tarda ATCC 15947 = NBRC 105688 TaxID=667121 RepID=A0AC61TF17_EDWTA|nr:sulfatase-like hydrolase/transferase [Edwardsiella tarda]AKH89471.1 sulfatase-like hydrolase/transferase [Edwardsiella tarda]ATI63102.1 phosphoethanolamine transferase [Edwardsiella tarda]UAL57858.1 sulfatase-like hydrolase/transferase [Edwardsiella tarda]UCP99081.1 sulfatase-like hydrolase/transferase [Edwardsiella tarda ATCC 15947 = NBRC 105688]UCQ10304.1 sulfatase-like hydrolase/transferase [Edwardsiella tarda]
MKIKELLLRIKACCGELLTPYPLLYLILASLINLGLGYPFSALYALGFASVFLLLAHYLPRAQRVLLLICTLVAGLYYPFGRVFGPPNFNSVLALYSTNPEEAGEMAQIFPFWDYLIALFILLLGGLLVWRPIPREKRWGVPKTLYLLLALAGLLLTPVTNLSAGGDFRLNDTGYPVVRFIEDTTTGKLEVDREMARMQKLASVSDTWHVTAVKPRHQVYVLVIGESARRDALGAFGGKWPTTPFASQVNGIFFNDYLSAAPSTQKSLGQTLNLVRDGQAEYQNSIITLAKKAGFQTYWFSNQGQLGKYDTIVASIAKRADEVRFLKQGDFEDDKSTSDMNLLKFTQSALDAPSNGPKLIVYHLIGSHPKACDRTNNHFTTFVHTKETSCYLYSITQTDQFLRDLYGQLQQSGENFSLIYFSDHGLAFHEKGTRSEFLAHHDRYRQDYQVPLMILSSGDTRRTVIKARRSAHDFLHLFSDWTGIQSQEIVDRYRFISGQKAIPAKVMVQNFALKQVPYDSLEDDPFIVQDSAAQQRH